MFSVSFDDPSCVTLRTVRPFPTSKFSPEDLAYVHGRIMRFVRPRIEQRRKRLMDSETGTPTREFQSFDEINDFWKCVGDRTRLGLGMLPRTNGGLSDPKRYIGAEIERAQSDDTKITLRDRGRRFSPAEMRTIAEAWHDELCYRLGVPNFVLLVPELVPSAPRFLPED